MVVVPCGPLQLGLAGAFEGGEVEGLGHLGEAEVAGVQVVAGVVLGAQAAGGVGVAECLVEVDDGVVDLAGTDLGVDLLAYGFAGGGGTAVGLRRA